MTVSSRIMIGAPPSSSVTTKCNKTVEIRAVFEDGNGPPVQVDSEVEIHQEGRVKGPTKVPMAQIN